MPQEPVPIRWTAHALVRADSLGVARQELEDGVLARHAERRRNPREADWLVDVGRFRVA